MSHDLRTPVVAAELAIVEAHRLVEEMPADERLTHAAQALLRARGLVLDFVAGVPFGQGYPRPVPDALRTDLTHLLSKYAGVEHSGTVLDGTTIARQILSDLRSVIAANPKVTP